MVWICVCDKKVTHLDTFLNKLCSSSKIRLVLATQGEWSSADMIKYNGQLSRVLLKTLHVFKGTRILKCVLHLACCLSCLKRKKITCQDADFRNFHTNVKKHQIYYIQSDLLWTSYSNIKSFHVRLYGNSSSFTCHKA